MGVCVASWLGTVFYGDASLIIIRLIKVIELGFQKDCFSILIIASFRDCERIPR